MKILISTGIYPPKIGGPAQYSKNLKNTFERMGHKVYLSTYGFESYLPTGIRHFCFLLKVFPKVFFSDFVVVMDMFSVGFPTILACKVLGKKSIIRTGGDFLWEQYVERTQEKVLLRNFYSQSFSKLNWKERLVYKMTKWSLNNASLVVFSTEWQKNIFIPAYKMNPNKVGIIENYYGPKEEDIAVSDFNFVGSARDLVWKNLDVLRFVFDRVQKKHTNVGLNTKNTAFDSFMKEIKNSYAVVLVSLGDISPNIILDAIRYNRPFICTKEVGIYERIKDIGIFVDPLNIDEIENAVLKLLDKNEYENAKQKVKQFSFTHSWEDICNEFLKAYNLIK